MTATVQNNFKYVGGAIIIHALAIGLFVAATLYSPRVVIPQLNIQARLIDSSSLNPPKPQVDPHEQERLEQQKLEQQKREQEQAEQAHQKEQKEKEEQLRVEQKDKEKQAEMKRVADAQQEVKHQKQVAEQKRVEEIKQKQREVEQKRQAESDAKDRARREAELKAQLAEEEGRNQAVNAGVLDRWQAQVQQKIIRSWIKPPAANASIDCYVAVTQSAGGMVLSAKVTQCNGDAAVRQSIESATLNASPLPLPSDSHAFMRSFTLRFNPRE